MRKDFLKFKLKGIDYFTLKNQLIANIGYDKGSVKLKASNLKQRSEDVTLDPIVQHKNNSTGRIKGIQNLSCTLGRFNNPRSSNDRNADSVWYKALSVNNNSINLASIDRSRYRSEKRRMVLKRNSSRFSNSPQRHPWHSPKNTFYLKRKSAIDTYNNWKKDTSRGLVLSQSKLM